MRTLFGDSGRCSFLCLESFTKNISRNLVKRMKMKLLYNLLLNMYTFLPIIKITMIFMHEICAQMNA